MIAIDLDALREWNKNPIPESLKKYFNNQNNNNMALNTCNGGVKNWYDERLFGCDFGNKPERVLCFGNTYHVGNAHYAQPDIEKKRTEKEALIEIDLLNHALEDATKEIEAHEKQDREGMVIYWKSRAENQEKLKADLETKLAEAEDYNERAYAEIKKLKATIRDIAGNYSNTLELVAKQNIISCCDEYPF